MQSSPLILGTRRSGPEDGARLAAASRRVLCLASTVAGASVSLVAASSVQYQDLDAPGSDVGARIFTLMSCTLLFLCGLVGARRRDAHLMCCFCGCNLLMASAMLLGLLVFGGHIQYLKFLVAQCGPESPPSDGCPPDIWAKICRGVDPEMSQEACYEHIKGEVETLNWALKVVLIGCAPIAAGNCLSFWFGYSLYKQLRDHAVVEALARAAAVQPRRMQPEIMLTRS